MFKNRPYDPNKHLATKPQQDLYDQVLADPSGRDGETVLRELPGTAKDKQAVDRALRGDDHA